MSTTNTSSRVDKCCLHLPCPSFSGKKHALPFGEPPSLILSPCGSVVSICPSPSACLSPGFFLLKQLGMRPLLLRWSDVRMPGCYKPSWCSLCHHLKTACLIVKPPHEKPEASDRKRQSQKFHLLPPFMVRFVLSRILVSHLQSKPS